MGVRGVHGHPNPLHRSAYASLAKYDIALMHTQQMVSVFCCLFEVITVDAFDMSLCYDGHNQARKFCLCLPLCMLGVINMINVFFPKVKQLAYVSLTSHIDCDILMAMSVLLVK